MMSHVEGLLWVVMVELAVIVGLLIGILNMLHRINGRKK